MAGFQCPIADIASGALFLISDASAWLTGEVLVVDGGAGVNARG